MGLHSCFTRMVFLVGALTLGVSLGMASPLLGKESAWQATKSALTANLPTQAFGQTVAYSSHNIHAALFGESQSVYQSLLVHSRKGKWRRRDDEHIGPPGPPGPQGPEGPQGPQGPEGNSAGASAQTLGSPGIMLGSTGTDVISRSITAPYNGGLHIVFFNATATYRPGTMKGDCSIIRDDKASTVPNGDTPMVTWSHLPIPDVEDIRSISVSGTWMGTMGQVTYTANCGGEGIVIKDISLNVIVVPNDFSGL